MVVEHVAREEVVGTVTHNTSHLEATMTDLKVAQHHFVLLNGQGTRRAHYILHLMELES